MKYFLFLLVPALAFARQVTVKTQADFTPTTVSLIALSVNKNRQGLVINNKGTNSVLIKFASAHSGTEGLSLAAGGVIDYTNVPADAVYMKLASSTGSNSVSIMEFE